MATPSIFNLDPPRSVSVIIPVRNGGLNFRRCLAAVRECIPAPDEVIVVDDGSADNSIEAARAWGARAISTDRSGRGPALARNLGAQSAAGDIVFFVDADVALHPDAIGLMLRRFHHEPGLAACFFRLHCCRLRCKSSPICCRLRMGCKACAAHC